MVLSRNKKQTLTNSKTAKYGIGLAAFLVAFTAMPSVSGAVPIKQKIDIQRAAEQFGFSKRNKDFSYDKVERKSGAVTYYGVKQGKDFKAEKVTLDIQEESGKLRVTLENITTIQEDVTATLGNLTILYSDVDANTKLPQIIDFKNNDNLRFDVSGSDIKLLEDRTTSSIAQFAVNGIEVKNGKVKFTDFRVRDVVSNVSIATFKIGGIDISGINDNLFEILNSLIDDKPDKTAIAKDNWSKIKMDMFRIYGVEFSSGLLNGNNNGKPTRFDGIKLGLFEISGLTPTNLKYFGFKGLDGGGMYLGDEVKTAISELSFSNVNLLYLKALLYGEDGDNSLLNKSISEVMINGPLSPTAQSVRLAGVDFRGGGAKFTIDNLEAKPTFDANNIITRMTMPRANIGLEVTNKEGMLGKEVLKFLNYWGVDALRANMEGDVKYSPIDGTIEYTNNRIHADKLGEVNFDGKVSGVNDFLKNVKVKEIANIYTNFNAIDSDKDEVFDTLNGLLNIYRDINLDYATFTYNDFGLMNNVALSQAVERGTTAKAIRKEWADTLRSQAKDNEINPMGIDLINALSKFSEKGKNNFSVSYKPSSPVKLAILFDKNTKSKDVGQSITYK